MLAAFDQIRGTSHITEHHIAMHDERPIKQRYFPKNPKMQGEINQQVDELLAKGCIEPSKSPHSAPIVVVKKKTGKWRLCVDFRQLNSKSIKDAYPLPRAHHILDQLREARYITSVDLKDGYWQIPMTKSSRPLTADRSEIQERQPQRRSRCVIQATIMRGGVSPAGDAAKPVDQPSGECKWIQKLRADLEKNPQ